MSSNILDPVIVPENMVRDFIFTNPANANQTIDLPATFNCMGLDLFVRNRGAAAITVGTNVGAGSALVVTVDPGDVYTLSHTKIWFVEVLAAVAYDLQITGVKISTLQRRKLMK